MKGQLLNRVKIGLLIGLPILAVTGIVVPYLIGTPRLTIGGAFFTLPLIIGPILFVLLRRREPTDDSSIGLTDQRPFLIAFCAFMTIAGVILSFEQHLSQSIPVIAALSLAGATIFAQIVLFPESRLSQRRFSVSILSQLGFFVTTSVWRITLRYPLYFGGTDVFPHMRYISHILESGAPHQSDLYGSYPLFHIFAAFIQDLLGPWTSVPESAYLLTGAVFALIPALIFLVSRRIVSNERIALLAAFITAVFPTVLSYGLYSIPRSIIPVFAILIILVHLLDIKRLRRSIVVLVTIFSITYYHPSSFPFLIFVFGGLYLIDWLLSYIEERPRTQFSSFAWVSVMLLLSVITVAQWSVIGGRVLVDIVGLIVQSLTGVSGVPNVASGQTGTSLPVLDYLHWTLFILSAVLGVLFILDDEDVSIQARSFVILGFGLLLVSVPGPIQALDLLKSLNLSRFSLYTFLFVAIACSYGIVKTIERVSLPTRAGLTPVVIFAIILILASPAASSGELLVADDTTNHLNEREIEAFDFILEHRTGEIHADYVSGRYFRYAVNDNNTYSAQVHADNLYFQSSEDESATLIIRRDKLENGGVNLHVSHSDEFDYWYAGTSFERFYPNSPLWESLDRNCRVYDSGDVEMYQCLDRNG